MTTETTNEALRLMANRRVRNCAIAAVASMIATMLVIAVNIDGTSRFGWFVMGFCVACMFGTAANLLALVSSARKMNEGLDATQDAATVVADIVTRELRRRGEGFEALVSPGEGVVIRRQESHPTRH